MLSRLDYGSATLAGIHKHLLHRLQSTLNAAARLICRARKYDHVYCFRDYTVCSRTHQIQTGHTCVSLSAQLGLKYLARDLQWADDTDSRQRLRSSSSQRLIVPRTRLALLATAVSVSLLPASGKIYQCLLLPLQQSTTSKTFEDL